MVKIIGVQGGGHLEGLVVVEGDVKEAVLEINAPDTNHTNEN